ncbi:hypothetical protein GGR56DRAFT_678880 [Xylariaceae sp. FL0804]|nr:hypothetical protein GGR56DRAFT_678880 [Xylariaceae sp. FL0804]
MTFLGGILQALVFHLLGVEMTRDATAKEVELNWFEEVAYRAPLRAPLPSSSSRRHRRATNNIGNGQNIEDAHLDYSREGGRERAAYLGLAPTISIPRY